MDDRMNIIVFGHKLGTASGWDGAPGEYYCYYDFLPEEELKHLWPDNGRDLNIVENTGIFTVITDEDEEVEFPVKLHLVFPKEKYWKK